MATVFLSYAAEDNDFAELTRYKLETAGIKVWIDQGDLNPGDDWKNEIDNGIHTSAILLVVISPSSIKSTYVTYEWAFAMGKGKRIIPLILKQEEMHPKLAELQHLDFTNIRARPWQRLVDVISQSLTTKQKEKKRTSVLKGEFDIYGIAKDQIINYLERKGFKKVSFERIRKNIDPDYDDNFLMEVIRKYSTVLRRAVLSGQKPGVAKL